MTTPIDAHQVLMTGENSFIRLSHDGGKTMSDRTSHWRVLWCPAGAGHVLFMQGELTDGEVLIYSDEISVARWLQRTIETLLHPPFADEGVAVLPAEFTREGDPRSTTVETIESDEDIIRMTWYDCIESVHPERPSRHRGPPARGPLHLHPGPLRPACHERPDRDRLAVAGAARRPPVLECGARMVGVLAQAPGLTGAGSGAAQAAGGRAPRKGTAAATCRILKEAPDRIFETASGAGP